ncbi:MAG: hypothetical protein ACYTFY_14480, partial [Planctomycetota bacterium]
SKGQTNYGLSTQYYSYGFGPLFGGYVPAPQSASGDGIWTCPSNTQPQLLHESPWGWTTSDDKARWRGTYNFAYRTWNSLTSNNSLNPANGASGGYWPATKMRGKSFSYIFDNVTYYNADSAVPTETGHSEGFNCAYYDASAKFYTGAAADLIDSYAESYGAVHYNSNAASVKFVFDLEKGIDHTTVKD